MTVNEFATPLQMVWPVDRLTARPIVQLPSGFPSYVSRRGYPSILCPHGTGWPGWNDEKLHPWLKRMLSDGWFMVIHENTDEIVATAMTLTSEVFPDGIRMNCC